jgi:hypothetical protein
MLAASAASVARTPKSVKAKGGDDHYFTVVFQEKAYYRWVDSRKKMKNGIKSCSLL